MGENPTKITVCIRLEEPNNGRMKIILLLTLHAAHSYNNHISTHKPENRRRRPNALE
jgi:hypothetical protein